MVEEVAGPRSAWPKEDVVLHVGSWPLESCQVAKPLRIEAGQGELRCRGSF